MKGCRFTYLFVAAFGLFLFRAGAAIPAPEQLLPQDTLFVVTAPDFARMRQIYRGLPQTKLWEDPAMKPLKDRFNAAWQQEFVRPLERDLNVSLDTYASLPQGQLTFALVQNGWQGNDDRPMGFLLLLDAKDKSALLKTNLAELRRNWVDAGKMIRRETIRGVEFSIYPISSNNLPKTLRKFFPAPYQFTAPPGEVGSKSDTSQSQSAGSLGPLFDGISTMLASSSELFVGQFDSLLIVGNSSAAVEKVVTRLTGGAMPPLADFPAYQSNQVSLFRDAPFYGWVNAKLLFDILTHKPPEPDASDEPDPLEPFKPEESMTVMGLTGLKTAAFSFNVSNEGSLFQVVVNVPDSGRRGFFKILAAEGREDLPPPFVPADAMKFWRCRLDGQKTWDTLEQMLSDGSPQSLNTLNWILDTAAARAKEIEPGFDLRKALVTNLGNDFIHYEKPPRDDSASDLASPPSLLLVGSPQPETLTAALKGLFVIFPDGDSITDRDFLGRKIYSVPMPDLALAMPGAPRQSSRRMLSFAAGASYVALSTDPSILEEYLRSSESLARPLREKAGLLEAAQKVGGPGAYFLGYDNQEENMRAVFDTVKRDPSSVAGISGLSPLPGLSGFSAEKGAKGWMDASLLPPFDQVSRYFFFNVYGLSANTDNLTLKFFSPAPPYLHASEASAK